MDKGLPHAHTGRAPWGVFGVWRPEISGKNLTSITKGFKLSVAQTSSVPRQCLVFDKGCFQEMASTGLKTYLNQFRPALRPDYTACRSFQRCPRPLAGGQRARCPFQEPHPCLCDPSGLATFTSKHSPLPKIVTALRLSTTTEFSERWFVGKKQS